MDVDIWDRREVHIRELPEGLISHTPTGRIPVRCTRAEIHYDIPTGQLGMVWVWGYLVEDKDVERRAATLKSYGRERARNETKRMYRVDYRTRTAPHAPDWLAELIEKYRPTPTTGSES